MKTIYYTKDEYQGNTVRVNYFERNAFFETLIFEYDEQAQKPIQKIKKEYYDKLLFCQRLEWLTNENELDSYIEEVCQYWENRINT